MSREQVIRMKAERNCLRNMSSSSDEDCYPRQHSKQSGRAGNQRKGHSAAQVAEKAPIIRNTNHHKSQSIGDAVPHMQAGLPAMGEAPDSIFDGNQRISYDESDQRQPGGGRYPVSMSFTQGRTDGGQNTLHERRLSHNCVDPGMRMSNASFQPPPSKASKHSKMSKMRSSVSQSSLLAKQVDKNGKLDEIIKRSQELRERRKQSQSRAGSRERQQNTTRLSLQSNGQSKKAMMQTLNVPEPQILIHTRPSLVSASGEFHQNPNLTDRTGAMSFA